MSFGLFPALGVLLGLLGLATVLWFLQRLRVQHQEVEVISTLFWQAAIKETRARVFVRKFRHWPAWLLLVAIASLIWLLLSQPQSQSNDGMQHVVLLDWSQDDAEVRSADLGIAIDQAASLPPASREIVALGSQLHTLLASGEEVQIASVRANLLEDQGTPGIHWALESLAARANADSKLAIHLVGDQEVDRRYLESLPDQVEVFRISRETNLPPPIPTLHTLGFGDSSSGDWKTVDLRFAFTPEETIDNLEVKFNDQAIESESLNNNQFTVRELPAAGGLVRILVNGQQLGALTLPTREAIQVSLEDGVPDVLRELVELDEAFEFTDAGGEVTIGFSEKCNFRLTSQEASAFEIGTDQEDPNAALLELVDELALTQVDATSLAQQSGQVVDVQVRSADKRQIGVWDSLFSPAFDFIETRACPIFVAKSIRWLAEEPAEVTWAAQGETLPAAAPDYMRAGIENTQTADGRELKTSRLTRPVTEPAELTASPAQSVLAQISPYTWLGILVSILLVGEWYLFQRGRMP